MLLSTTLNASCKRWGGSADGRGMVRAGVSSRDGLSCHVGLGGDHRARGSELDDPNSSRRAAPATIAPSRRSTCATSRGSPPTSAGWSATTVAPRTSRRRSSCRRCGACARGGRDRVQAVDLRDRQERLHRRVSPRTQHRRGVVRRARRDRGRRSRPARRARRDARRRGRGQARDRQPVRRVRRPLAGPPRHARACASSRA